MTSTTLKTLKYVSKVECLYKETTNIYKEVECCY